MRDWLPRSQVGDLVDFRALLAALPPMLSDADIAAANRSDAELGNHRTYRYGGWTFDVPPGVLRPGGTSQVVLDRLMDGTIPLAGRSFAAMGCGLGVETVVAATKGAREIYALDVHPASVAATDEHYRRYVGDLPGTTMFAMVSDLFESVPDGVKLDVVTFNPPVVGAKVSDDPDVIRIVCVGPEILHRFFDQVSARRLLSPDGEIYVVMSNTSPLREIVGYAVEAGFEPEVAARLAWPGSKVITHLFRFRWMSRPIGTERVG